MSATDTRDETLELLLEKWIDDVRHAQRRGGRNTWDVADESRAAIHAYVAAIAAERDVHEVEMMALAMYWFSGARPFVEAVQKWPQESEIERGNWLAYASTLRTARAALAKEEG